MRQIVQRIVVIFRFAYHLFSPPKKQLHTDRFASADELEDITSDTMDGTSLLMGVTEDNRILSIRPTVKQQELGNILVDARTRGGKGILAEPQILTWQHSLIINDIKGELRYKTGGKKSEGREGLYN